jgi:hypothetical protein
MAYFLSIVLKRLMQNEKITDTFSIAGIAAELGISEEEVKNAVETVGPDYERVKEFINRNHTETDYTDDADNS